jgi:5-methylcytosine-specific restriction endonuclease McrA
MTFQEMLQSQLSETKHSGHCHIKQFTPDELWSMIDTGDGVTRIDRHKVNLRSWRYQVFRRSLVCVDCGVEGTIFCLDKKRRDAFKAHFNLYGIKPNGRVVMLTKDHILPVSLGGKDALDNFQTMCESCNCAKGNEIPHLLQAG